MNFFKVKQKDTGQMGQKEPHYNKKKEEKKKLPSNCSC